MTLLVDTMQQLLMVYNLCVRLLAVQHATDKKWGGGLAMNLIILINASVSPFVYEHVYGVS